MTRRPSFRAGPRSQALDRALKLSRYLAAAAATALLLQLRFSADGNFLYTGARRDAALQCWDLRHASGEEQWMGGRVGGWGRTLVLLLRFLHGTSCCCCWLAILLTNPTSRPNPMHRLAGIVYTLQRQTATTNQRIAFDIEPCGRHLATGAAACVLLLSARGCWVCVLTCV